MAKKILIVDDEKEIVKTMQDILERNGYEVTPETNASKALEDAQKNEYDLILLDIMMPMSGYEVLRLMKKNATGKPKTIFVTIVPKKEVDLNGVDSFIQKPFDIKGFISEVKRVLGDK